MRCVAIAVLWLLLLLLLRLNRSTNKEGCLA
jgi:hypothetical protein